MFQNHIEKLREIVTNLYQSSSFKGRIARGGMWLGGGAGTEHALRLVRNMIMTRILAPEVFGLMALILAVNILFESFTQIGIKEAVIQNPRGKETTFLNGAFWISFVRGAFLYVIAFLSVPFITHIYDKPELVPMMRVAFLSIFVIGAISPKAYISLKEMNYRKWACIYHGGSVIGIVTAITLGILWQNIWALVIGFTCENFARSLMSYVICPFIPRLNFDKENLHSLFSYARNIFGLPILVFLYFRTDVFIVGKLCSTSDLGIFHFAKNLTEIPYLLFTTLVYPILMPTFSKTQDDHELLSKRIFRSTKYLSLFFIPLLTIMACNARLILTLVYGPAYAAASIPFMLFCGSMVLRVTAVTNIVFFAIGMPEYIRRASIIRLIVMFTLIYPLVMKFGITGAALASLISGLAWSIFTVMKLTNVINLSLSEYVQSLKPGVLISLSIAGIVAVLNSIF